MKNVWGGWVDCENCNAFLEVYYLDNNRCPVCGGNVYIGESENKKEIKMSNIIEGWIVHFILSDQDAKEINKRRKDADLARSQRATNNIDVINVQGFQEHVGNQVVAGEHVLMVIVKVWNKESGYINGKCLLDGNDGYWVTSVSPGDGPHSWHWIERKDESNG